MINQSQGSRIGSGMGEKEEITRGCLFFKHGIREDINEIKYSCLKDESRQRKHPLLCLASKQAPKHQG